MSVLPMRATASSEVAGRLGKYRLIRRLAVGGMAELFLAEAEGLGGFQKQLVLKRILPQLGINMQFVQMFLDEARLAAQLHHANIAQVYDIGRANGSYFFTMEYVEGHDLREVCRAFLRAGQLMPLEHAITIVSAACAGLHYAHEKVGADGTPLFVVHRDVSPANVLVTYEGAVKIVDFGVAKARSQQQQTQAGTLKGKISYMSPEQCRGDGLDRRADVFALGILLFELTTGTRLYRGDNEFKTLTRIVTEDAPPPSSRRANYPRGLEAIVMKALQRDRDKRFGSAQEMQLALDALAHQERLPTSTIALGSYMKQLFAAELAAARFDRERGPLTLVVDDSDDPDAPLIELGHDPHDVVGSLDDDEPSFAPSLAAVELVETDGEEPRSGAALGVLPMATAKPSSWHWLTAKPFVAAGTAVAVTALAVSITVLALRPGAPKLDAKPPAVTIATPPAAPAPDPTPPPRVATASVRPSPLPVAEMPIKKHHHSAKRPRANSWDPDSALLPSK